jgi:chromosome segregation ATPase
MKFTPNLRSTRELSRVCIWIAKGIRKITNRKFKVNSCELTLDLKSRLIKPQDVRSSFLSEKESEINQIRTEYVNIINQKNSYIKNKEREINDLQDQVYDLSYQVKKLKDDEKLNEHGLREHIESLKKLVEVKNQSIEKLESEINVLKEENSEYESKRSNYFTQIKHEKEGKFQLLTVRDPKRIQRGM